MCPLNAPSRWLSSPLASYSLGSELGQQEGKVSIPLSPLSLWVPRASLLLTTSGPTLGFHGL